MTVFSLDPAAMQEGYGEAILSLAMAKLHLRVDGDDEDDLIGALRDAAIDLVERYCGIPLGPRSGNVWQSGPVTLGSSTALFLGQHPVTAITAIAAIDSTGADVTADPVDFTVGPHDRLRPKPGKAWPDAAGGLTITFDAGYAEGEAATKAPGMVQAVRLMLGHLYKNREAVVSVGMTGEVPMGVLFACSRYRMPVL